MLQKLRRTFVAITMSLVGIVLAGVLGMSLFTAHSSMQAAIAGSLERALGDGSSPAMGQMPPQGYFPGADNSDDADDDWEEFPEPDGDFEPDDDELAQARQFVLVLKVVDGQVYATDERSLVSMSEETLAEAVKAIVGSSEDAGRIESAHLAWQRAETSDGYLVALMDTTAMDQQMSAQLANSALIFVGGMAALFVVTLLLSRWALRPVEESWEQQRRFVADASHELKTPLAVIKANSDILLGHRSNLPEEDVRWVESTADEAQRMSALVTDLLDLARADNEGQSQDAKAAFVEVDLAQLVEKVCLQFDAVAFERGCEIECSTQAGTRAKGNPARLEQLVTTLVDNACKYAATGSVVHVRLAQEAGHARLTVTNAGEPIPTEDLPHVFERFYRSDRARTHEGAGGYGLGLAIAKGIADAHGAELSVASSTEAGTTFTLVI